MVNLSAFIRFHAIRTPDSPAVLYDGLRISYAELYARTERIAAYLHERGIDDGDVVAVFMKNSAAFVELALATSYLGAVFLPINYRLAPDEADYILTNADARLLFVDDEFAPGLAPLLGKAVSEMVSLDAQAQRDSRILAAGAGAPPPVRVKQPPDLFRLMYTSGTTDHPKGVMHSYENFYWKSMDHVMALGLSAADRLLVVGPLYHVGAFDLPGLAVLWVGGMLCIHREFGADAALQAIEDERLTCAWFAPVMTSALLSLEGRERCDVSSLKWAIGGGEKTPESRIRAFTSLFTEGRYIDGYGLTESVSGDTLMEAGMEIAKIGSTGRALAHVEIEIRDDDGKTLPAGTEGEICLRGPKITKGYWRDPVKTEKSFFGDWFRTGDVGYLDADGFLFLTDRKKDLIISGGENIASSEVERVIYEMPQVSEAAVIGLPDVRWGERPVAVVVPHPGQIIDYDLLATHCRGRLAGFKVPKEMHVVDALPRNPSGKVLKRILRQRFGNG